MDCIFCKIINGEIPCAKIYEDDSVLAFLDINPINKGHTLVASKKHYANLYETPDELLCKISTAVKKISIAVKRGVGATGINVINNNEPSAGQIVLHYHIHIIPRFENDEHRHWTGKEKYEGEEMEDIKQKICNFL